MNLARFLAARAAATPRASVLLAPRISFGELEARAAATARCLGAAGVVCGERVALALGNGLSFVVALHAAARLGARVALLNTRLTAAELAPQLARVSPRLVLADEGTGAAVTAAAATAGVACRLVAPRGCPLCGNAALHPGVAASGSGPRASDPFALLFTSGTSGSSKALALSHANLAWSAHASALRLGDRAGDRWLATLPLFHVGGLAILVRSLLQGSAVAIQPRFDPEALGDALDREGISLLPLVPTMLSRLLDARGARRAPATLRCVLLGGAGAAPALLERARSLGFPVRTTYGLSEAASQVATATATTRSGVGPPLFGTRLRVVGAAGRALAAGEEGEIQVRGPTVAAGYWNDPEATARSFVDGWLRTGDLGRLDASGGLAVQGRREDRIVSGGENVSPAEVEAVLLASPDVAEAGVAGLPDADLGTRVVAWVVGRRAAAGAAAELDGWCRARLAGYKVPKEVRFVTALPRSATGKLQRQRLAELQPSGCSSESLSRQAARSALASAREKPSSSAIE